MERAELLLLREAKAIGLWTPVKVEVKAFAELARTARTTKAKDFIMVLSGTYSVEQEKKWVHWPLDITSKKRLSCVSDMWHAEHDNIFADDSFDWLCAHRTLQAGTSKTVAATQGCFLSSTCCQKAWLCLHIYHDEVLCVLVYRILQCSKRKIVPHE